MQQLEELKTVIDSVSLEVKNTFSNLSSEQLNRKPSPESWSIGQVLDHMIVINESYHIVVQNVRNGFYKAGWLGNRKMITDFWFNMIYKSIHPDNRKKSKTQTIWEPSESDVDADIVKQFLDQQERLKKLMDDSNDLVLSNTVIHSPAAKLITYTIGDAFKIIAAHEQRHLIQAKEVLKKILQN
ncbi:MAG: DinB family protein [Bacteroidetes bacterium]|nr:DinB family protein [Bacteroidota bacterium]MBK7108407.1 DinB family protein [Bacteroidota bacterium]MBK8486168.1 DinB family protein [Bacteroidota bacterium]MBK8681114.1 DinB family protein [Bacteroidota bacterium]